MRCSLACQSVKFVHVAANLKVRYPAVNFRGQIVYCRTLLEVEKATSELLEYIDAKKLTVDRVSLGFDTEWRPTFRRGAQQNKTAVLQLCVGSDLCYVMHIYHSGVPSSLQSILADNATVKVGVSIAGDATKLLRDYGVSVNGLADLRHLANVKLGGSPRMWSLAALLERITCKQLEKPSRIRMGNWEAHILSRDQLNYAATDAYACWYLHEVLSSFPDAKNFEGEESTESVQT